MIAGVAALTLAVISFGRRSVVAQHPLAPSVLSTEVAPTVVEVALGAVADGPRILLYVTEECPYCREELSRWSRARVPEGAPGLVVIAPTPLPDSLAPPTAIVVTDTFGIMARELGVRAVPSLFVVDARGTVLEARTGVNEPDRIDRLLHDTISSPQS